MEITIITAIIGAVATILAAIITARTKDKASAKLESEIIRLRKQPASSSMLSAREYGIKIVSPAEYDNVGRKFDVSGTVDNLPEGSVIWTSTFEVYRDSEGKAKKRYWPQEPAIIKDSTDGKKWYSKIRNIGDGNVNETKEFLVLVVGHDGHIFFKYFEDAGKQRNYWHGITELTSDVVECGERGKVTFVPTDDDKQS